MKDLALVLSTLKGNLDREGILSIQIDKQYAPIKRNVVKVHINSHHFIDVMEDLGIPPYEVMLTDRKRETFPIELEACYEGVYFFTLIDEHEYQIDFEEWHTEEPNIDEEFLTGVGPDNEARMKEAGHKLEDFA